VKESFSTVTVSAPSFGAALACIAQPTAPNESIATHPALTRMFIALVLA
jgi:hypothetical protein